MYQPSSEMVEEAGNQKKQNTSRLLPIQLEIIDLNKHVLYLQVMIITNIFVSILCYFIKLSLVLSFIYDFVVKILTVYQIWFLFLLFSAISWMLFTETCLQKVSR